MPPKRVDTTIDPQAEVAAASTGVPAPPPTGAVPSTGNGQAAKRKYVRRDKKPRLAPLCALAVNATAFSLFFVLLCVLATGIQHRCLTVIAADGTVVHQPGPGPHYRARRTTPVDSPTPVKQHDSDEAGASTHERRTVAGYVADSFPIVGRVAWAAFDVTDAVMHWHRSRELTWHGVPTEDTRRSDGFSSFRRSYSKQELVSLFTACLLGMVMKGVYVMAALRGLLASSDRDGSDWLTSVKKNATLRILAGGVVATPLVTGLTVQIGDMLDFLPGCGAFADSCCALHVTVAALMLAATTVNGVSEVLLATADSAAEPPAASTSVDVPAFDWRRKGD
jgi:hypothetical protein